MLLKFNIIPNAVNKFTISLAVMYIQIVDTTNPRYANNQWPLGFSFRSVLIAIKVAKTKPRTKANDHNGTTSNNLTNAPIIFQIIYLSLTFSLINYNYLYLQLIAKIINIGAKRQLTIIVILFQL